MVNGKKIACPSCARKFVSNAAMQQHRADAHASKRVPRPVAQAPRRRQPRVATRPDGSVVMTGSDVVASTTVPASSTAGRALLGLRITPRFMSGTRLAQLSECWARWTPVSLKLRVVCAGAFTTFGTISVGWVADTSIEMSGTSQANLMRVSSARPSSEVKLNSQAVLSIPSETSRKWYLTSGLPEDTSHGSIISCVGANTGGYTGAVSVTFHLDWAVRFEGVDLEADRADDDLIRPDAGWTNLFTTSDGSFNSTVLTFKMHQGGNMVPWSAAHPAKVYTLAGSTRVPYVNTSGQVAWCQYFAPIQGYTTPGLLLFATASDASAYIKSGDVSKAIPYYSHCTTEVKPPIPVLKVLQTSVQETDSLEIRLLRLEMDELRRMLAAVSIPRSLVSDDGVRAGLQEFREDVREELQERPRGTLADPVKVLVEDPPRTRTRTVSGVVELQAEASGSTGSTLTPPVTKDDVIAAFRRVQDQAISCLASQYPGETRERPLSLASDWSGVTTPK